MVRLTKESVDFDYGDLCGSDFIEKQQRVVERLRGLAKNIKFVGDEDTGNASITDADGKTILTAKYEYIAHTSRTSAKFVKFIEWEWAHVAGGENCTTEQFLRILPDRMKLLKMDRIIAPMEFISDVLLLVGNLMGFEYIVGFQGELNGYIIGLRNIQWV